MRPRRAAPRPNKRQRSSSGPIRIENRLRDLRSVAAAEEQNSRRDRYGDYGNDKSFRQRAGLVGDVADERRRGHVAEDVDHKDVDGDGSSSNGCSDRIDNSSVQGPGVEQQKEERQEYRRKHQRALI